MEASELLKKYREGKCSPEELAMLQTWYQQYSPSGTAKTLTSEEREEDLTEIAVYLAQHITKERQNKQRWWYSAAAVFLLGTIGSWWLFPFQSADRQEPLSALHTSPLPGENRAFLTLSNGKKVALTAQTSAILPEQQGVKIRKTSEGRLIYEQDTSPGNTAPDGTSGYNIISTPKGGQFTVSLPDGTTVWLNAASSLRYPLRFSGKDREVELDGEAYFAVAGQVHQPFKVKKKRPDGSYFLVEVLGTQFNINAYDEERQIKTTLVEGRVRTRLSNRTDNIYLKPGQQVLLKNQQMHVSEVNLTDEVAWKDGDFAFNETDIYEVMRQLARWYNLSVSYNGVLRSENFTGYIARNVPLKDVLTMLEKGGGVKFTTAGNQVTVTLLNP